METASAVMAVTTHEVKPWPKDSAVATVAEASTSGAGGPQPPPSRIEELLEQQNALMRQHIALAEESQRRSQEILRNKVVNRKPEEVLRHVEPGARHFFREWRLAFRASLKEYIALCRACRRCQCAMEKGDLVEPFNAEARKPWEWGQFYRTVAMPINGVDDCLTEQVPANISVPNGDSQTFLPGAEHPRTYDIDAAFAARRSQHAYILQDFVVAHQKVALNNLTDALALPQQIALLQAKVLTWATEEHYPDSRGTSVAERAQRLERQALEFVELVHHGEMPKAEHKAKEDRAFIVSRTLIIAGVRILCAVVVASAVIFMDREHLTRLFAMIFSLVCGMALVWEEPVLGAMLQLLDRTPLKPILSGAQHYLTDSSTESPRLFGSPSIVMG